MVDVWRMGNTAVPVDTFLAGILSEGAEVKKIFLADKNINQRKGCFRNCFLMPGFQRAIFRDDMDILLEEMISSDLILFASPYYSASYTAIMARFFERRLPLLEVEIVGEMGSVDAFKFINNPLNKKAVVGLVQDYKDPSTA